MWVLEVRGERGGMCMVLRRTRDTEWSVERERACMRTSVRACGVRAELCVRGDADLRRTRDTECAVVEGRGARDAMRKEKTLPRTLPRTLRE